MHSVKSQLPAYNLILAWPSPQKNSDLENTYDAHSKRIWCLAVQKAHFTKITLTLMLKLDLDMIKMYHHTKNEVSTSRQTDTHTDSTKTLPYRIRER